MSPDQELCQHWKITRDVKERGYSEEKVLQQIESRRSDTEKYVKGQNKHADIEICVFPEIQAGVEQKIEERRLNLLIKISNDIHIEPLIDIMRRWGYVEINHEYDENDFQSILFKENISAKEIGKIAEREIPNLDDFGIESPEWSHGYLGFIQLFISYYIVQQVSVLNESR